MRVRGQKEKVEKRDNDEYLYMAETRALRYILQYPDQSHTLERPSLFSHKEAKVLLESILFIRENNLTLSPESLAQEANKRESKLQFSLIKNLLFNSTETFTPEDRVHILQELEATELKNNIATKVKATFDLLNSESLPNKDYFEQVNRSIAMLQNASLENFSTNLITLDKALDMYCEALNDRELGCLANSGDILLDRALVRKLSGGQIILIVGSTGAGKSLYALNLFDGFIDYGIPSIYCTLEMDLESTIDRLLAKRLEILLADLYDTIKIKDIKKKVEAERKRFLEDIANSNIKAEIVDNPSLSLGDLNAIISEFRGKHRLPLTKSIVIIVDLITQVKDFAEGREGYSMASNYELAVNYLNVIAKAQNVCFICTAQLNRDADTIVLETVEDVQKTRPTLNQVKNSHALSERSRVVLSIWRPRYYLDRYLPDEPETLATPDTLEVTILKQSQGKVGTRLNYSFLGETASIIPLLDTSSPAVNDMLSEEERRALEDAGF